MIEILPMRSFLYLKESRYPGGSCDVLKKTIRRKATMCFIRDGVLYVQKKKKKKNLSVSVKG